MTKGAREELLLLLQKCVRYDIIISPINKNLQERINIAPLVDLKERENSDELYKKWKISNA